MAGQQRRHGRVDQFEGVGALLIDGNNLLHRVQGRADPAAQRTLLPRLRAAIPGTIATVVMLDGHADAGEMRTTRIARGFEIRHSGSISADDALLRLIRDTPAAERSGVTLVTDDVQLSGKARHLGARTQRLLWLEKMLDGPDRPIGRIGSGPPPRSNSRPGTDTGEDEDRQPWRPGRGATRKHGNPKRGARRPDRPTGPG